MTDLDPPERDLFAMYRATGDAAVRNRLVERYGGLAASLARRFDQRGVPLEDLVQVAHLGVLNAVTRFDPARGVSFTTFATPTVLGELKRHFRDKTWTVKVSRGVKDLHVTVAPALSQLQQLLGRSPTIPEIAAHLNRSEDDVLEAIEAGAAYRPDSLDTPRQDGDESWLGIRVGIPDEPALTDARVTVRSLMAQLPERERTIVFMRYFEDLTQAEIAERVGVSQVHVSRLLRQSLVRLGRQT